MTYRLLIVSLTTLAITTSCSPAKDVATSKNNYNNQEIVLNNLISWLDILNQKEDDYLIFIYAETCGHCHDMIDEITSFAKEKILPTYFVDKGQNDIPISVNNEIGMSNINEISIVGTPTILEVNEGVLIANIPGIERCLSFLNQKRMNYC